MLSEVRERDLEAFANADVPFERLVEVLNPVRSTARNPLFQVGLSFQNLAETAFELPGLHVAAVEFESQLAKTSLQVTLYDRYTEDGTPAEIFTEFGYATDLFDEPTVRAFADRFVRILDAITADPTVTVGDIDLLDADENARILKRWNNTEQDVDAVFPGAGEATLVSLLDKSVAEDPKAVAIVTDTPDGAESLTYAELDARVNRLARELIARGIGAEDRVALAIRRSTDLVVAMYAVAKSGAAYVPIDPDQPAERVGYILETSAPKAVLTTAAVGFETELADVVRIDEVDLSGHSDKPIADAERVRALTAANTAYVIFTSGSTGRPKGVALPHGAVVNQLLWKVTEFGLDPADAVLLKTAATFDLSVWEFWSGVACGGRLVIAAPDGHKDPAYLNELMAREWVTTLHVVPSMLDALLTNGLPDSLWRILAIGEALPGPLALRVLREHPRTELFNLYGPTEAAVSITNHRVTERDELSVSIGSPEWNSQVYVLDSRLRPVPVGVSGELYLAGAQLARGYFGRPDLTSDRFVANPFADNGSRMYRTGDLVAWQANGELEYRGRTDFQVKIRGFRIELGDIESALLRLDAVASAAVVAHTDPVLGDRLVAYVVGTDGEPDKRELQAALAAELPSYMIPSVFMALDALPLNANGKLDRKELPQPTFEKAVFRAPVSPIEQIVAGVFAEVLRVESGRIGLDDDFFQWGGNSLLATQVAARLGEALNTRVPVRLMFEASTVAALAARVERDAGAGRKALTAVARPDNIPLSLAQQRMWFLNRFDTQSAAYNVPVAVRLSGALDEDALRAAIADVVARHEILRTIYPQTENGAVQVILPPAQAVPELQVRTVSADEVVGAVVELTSTSFDVTVEVPIKVALFKIEGSEAVVATPSEAAAHAAAYTFDFADTEPTGQYQVVDPNAPVSAEYVLALVIHHISGDGSSVAPLTRDLMTAYAARSIKQQPGWTPLAVQYADYSIWQRELLGDENDPESLAAKQVAYWKQALAGLPDQLDLPADRPRPAVQSFHGGKIDIRIDAELHTALVELARTEGATLFMVVHTALAVLLSRLSGSDDIAIGTPMAGRGEAVLDDLIGMFVNTLVFRTQVDGGQPFAELLARQRETDIQAYANADVPFERLVEVLNPARSTARHPLFQVGLSFQNLTRSTLELPGLTVSGLDVDTELSQFDLHLIVSDLYAENGAAEGITGILTYATDIFDRETVVGFADRFVHLLREIVAAPRTAVGAIELLAPAERAEILDSRNNTAHQVDSAATLVSMLGATVAAKPTAIALIGPDGETLTYAELGARVNQLARELIARGIGTEDRVALAIRRSVDLVVAMYAVSVAGAAYVPVDPDQPAERVGYILETAAPACVLTTSRDGFELPNPRHPGALLGRDPHDEALDSGQKHAGMTEGLRTEVLRIDELELSGHPTAPVTNAERVRELTAANTAYVIFTSGSTGRPKGVALPHAAIANQLQWKTAEFGLGADDAVLLKTAATFDLSVWEFWSAAVSGGRLVIAAPDGHRDPAYLNELMARERVTTLHVVPSMLDALLTASEGTLNDSLRRVLAIGEALPAAVAQRFRAANPDASLFNLYGPTEAAVSITTHLVTDADQGAVSIGVPEWNSRVYVLDARLNPVPDGVSGELYLAGAQLARGYFAQPNLTADRFVANPFAIGERMYRTGDLVAWSADGELEYRGRTDFQVKIRGFRIELGEIEAALLALPEIAQTAVLAKRDERTGDRLVAYLVPTGSGIDVPLVKSALNAALPSYMVPSAFVVLDALPLNVNGKLDRKALPEPEFETTAFRAPSTPIEEIVAGVIAEVLGTERVGADDDFFALGGNSLLATQVAARIGAALDARVPVRAVFEASTVAGLAAKVEQHAGAGDRKALTAGTRPENVPLSLAQQRMWFLNQFDTASAAYNVPVAVRLTGALDVEALQQAVADVIGRHETLRTVYPQVDGAAAQVIVPVAQAIPDLTPVVVSAESVTERIAALITTGFDVTTEVPVHAALFRVEGAEEAEHVLVFVTHHIAADGWSMGPLTRDVMVAYASRAAGMQPSWAPLPVQYADYSLWQREVLGAEDDPASLIASQAEFWRTALADLPDELNLPSDRPRPNAQSFRGGRVLFPIGNDLHRGLQQIARTNNATMFMVVHTALAVFLARLSGTSDIAIGAPIAGRGEAELDNLIGMFVNTLVLRTEVSGQAGFTELLAAAKDSDLQAFAHADIPFERLVELLNPERSTARHPLFQVALSFENLPESSFELPGLRASAVEFENEIAKFDLMLTLTEAPADADAGMYAEFGYARDLFDQETVQGFADRFLRLLGEIIAAPRKAVGDLEILAADERADLITRTGGPAIAPRTLPELLADAVANNPVGEAVAFDGQALGYAELDAASSRLARVLIERGAGPETRVAVAIRRSFESVLAIWAVAKSGAAFVPVDPSYPADRIAHMVNDSGAVLGLTVDAEVEGLPPVKSLAGWISLDDPMVQAEIGSHSAEPVTDTERWGVIRPEHVAYVIYTSGTTGMPKGVVVTHAGLANFATEQIVRYHLDSGSRALHFASPSFDASVLEYLLAIGAGGTLVVVPPGVYGGEELAELIKRERATHAFITPAALATLDPKGLDSLRVLVAGGEAVPADLVEKWAIPLENRTIRAFHNGYGPTETTIMTNISDALTPGDLVTIGGPIRGMQALILDARLRPVPVGVAGELYLSGIQLSRGYHDRPGLSAERFVANPFLAGERMYRSGDVVRWTPTGEVEYVGRNDFQVKVRGFRIELGEIDAALASHETVDFAVTVGHKTEAGATILAAYVLPVAGRSIDIAALTEHVAGRLPEYMVPTAITVLDAIPLTPVGKLDRRALPEPVFTARDFRAPVTEVEAAIAEVFADVLGVEQVGADDSFFALGGDSILSIQLVSRAKARGIVFSPRDVFEQRTVAGLAEVAKLGGDTTAQKLAELPGGGVGDIPLTPIMHAILSSGSSYQRFSQSMPLRLPDGITREVLVGAISALYDHHDVLRSRLRGNATEGFEFEALPKGAVDVDALVHRVELAGDVSDEELTRVGSIEFDAALGRLDPANAAMVQFVWFAFAPEGSDEARVRRDVLLIVAHHMVVDGVSWRILIPDLGLAWSQVAFEQPIALPETGTSMRRWAHALVEESRSEARVAELPFWQRVTETPDPLLGSRAFDPKVDTFDTVERVEVSVPASVTEAVLTSVPGLYRGGVNDGLLSALAMAVARWRGETAGGSALIKLEGHGREEEIVAGADLSRTVGWFTAAFPVRLDLNGADLSDAFEGGNALGDIVKSVKEQLLALPDKGLGWGLLRHLNPETSSQLRDVGQISFNYLGRVSAGEVPEGMAELGWVPVDDLGRLDGEMDADMPANATLDINAIVTDGEDGPQLGAAFSYPSGLLERERVQEFADLFVAALTALAEHAKRPDAGGFTPSDLALVKVEQSDIEVWEQAYPALSDVWPLSPLQSGLLFHAMLTQNTVDVYTIQTVLDLSGVVDIDRLKVAAQAILDRYPSLRTAFVTDADGQAHQVVLDRVEAPFQVIDLTDLPEAERNPRMREMIEADRADHFDLSAAPLMRFNVFRISDELVHLVITTHHILVDGWSMPLLMRDLLVLYAVRGDLSALPRVASFRNYLAWLAGRNRDESLEAWKKALAGVSEPTQLAPAATKDETYEIGRHSLEIDAERTRALTKRAGELNVTLNTLIQTSWAVLVGRLTGRSDVVFGATVSGRPGDLPGVESMVGLFINTVPVRIRVDDRLTIAGLLQRVQRDQADLLEHHHIGLTEILQLAGAGAEFDTMMAFESYPVDKDAIAAASSIDGMSVSGVGINDNTHYPMSLVIMAGETIDINMRYLDSRFTADEVATLAARFTRILDALLGDPEGLVGDIDILDASERARILAESAVTPADSAAEPARVGTATVANVLAEVVEEDPQAPALLSDGQEIAYHVLDRRSSQLARLLIDRGAGPGDIVAVALPHTVDAVVAVWAIQKAGAAALFADGLSFGEILAAGAGFGIAQEPAASSVRWLVPSDPKVQADLAARPAHPVSYTDRVRPLSETDPAFVYREGETWATLTQAEALERAANLRSEYELDYESTTYTTGSIGRAAIDEFLASSTAGALSVLPGGDIAADLEDGEVTHWFTVDGDPVEEAGAEIRTIG
nr:non-ribosomal peptide synthetase [Nocardia concava]